MSGAKTKNLGELTSPEAGLRRRGALLAVPLGSTEQHGPHLPLSTDTLVAQSLAAMLANRRDDVVVAPTMPYGSSGEHASFAGTLSIGQDALERFVVELVRSADGFAGVVVVSGHGGNAEPIARAVEQLGREGREVLAWWPTIEATECGARRADAHAGWVETSVLLAIRPEAVRMELAEAGELRPMEEILPTLRRSGVSAVSGNGVLGDPTGSSAEAGRRILDELGDDLCESVASRWGRGR